MTPHRLATMRELHSRINDRTHVRPLWSEPDNQVAVSVADARRARRS